MRRNKKGEFNGLGIILVVAITLIVGVVLFQVIAQEAGKATSTEALLFHDLGTTAANDTVITLTEWRALNEVTMYNETGHATIDSSYFTVANNVVTDGDLTVTITLGAAIFENYTNNWRINATGQPTTYIADSGARAMTSLIAIFFALALAVVALTPTLRREFMDMISK